MDPSWSTEASRSGSESAERRGRPAHSTIRPGDHRRPSMMAHLSPMEIEDEILRSSDLLGNHVAVLLYLRLDIWSLESIYALRISGSDELAVLHPTLFSSPPEPLFNMIYTLRHFPGLDLAGTIARIEACVHPEKNPDRSTERKIKIAPPGQAYGCPSKYCKKVFIKSGHAANHVEKQHPEYLKLHPDYQPSHFLVEHSRSRPTSPELERQEKQQSTGRQHELRPGPSATRSTSGVPEGLSVYFNDGPGGSLDHASPRFQGDDSQGDSDEAPRLVPHRGHSRNTPHASPFHPSRSQKSYDQLCSGQSRYLMLSTHSKRGRESSSSSESIATAGLLEEAGATRFRRHAKRRSVIDCY